MADETEAQREDRARALREEAEDRRVQLAVKSALLDASITKELSEHQAHLLTINGSIDKNVVVTEELVTKVDKLDLKVVGLIAKEHDREEAAELGRQAAAAN